MNLKKIFTFFFLFLSMVNCASPQRPELPLRPNVYTADVPPPPSVDEDAYHVVLPPIPDASIHLTSSPGETIVPLRLGQTAPYAGVLFSIPAVARVEVEYRGLQEQCRIDRQADIDRISARAVTDIRLLQTSLQAQSESLNLMLRSRDVEIDRLYRSLQSAQHPPVDYLPYILVGAGFLVVGAGIGLTVGLLAR